MAPTILIAGATGNTGRSVVETLPELLKASKTLSQYRILAQTRSKHSPAARKFASLGVEIVENNWTELNIDWFRRHEVERVFIASHNEPTQFAEEGQFLTEAFYYPRTHWALEQMLSQPEFAAMQWTSLQPNVFHSFVLAPAVQYVKQHRDGEAPNTLRLLLSADTPVGVVDAWDVGVFAAHLLAQIDITAHNKKRYVLNGPEDITGQQVVDMVEAQLGAKVEDVKFKDVSFIEQWADSTTKGSKNVIRSIIHAPVTGWEGECTASTTSKEVLEIAPPRGTAKEAFEAMLQQ